jgi:ferredoxin-like protein FixX
MCFCDLINNFLLLVVLERHGITTLKKRKSAKKEENKIKNLNYMIVLTCPAKIYSCMERAQIPS